MFSKSEQINYDKMYEPKCNLSKFFIFYSHAVKYVDVNA
jgi:hypothetical protein